MNENMDLTPYLDDLRCIDDANEDLDPIIEKQKIIERQSERSPKIDDSLATVPETSIYSLRSRALKEEMLSDEERNEAKKLEFKVPLKKESAEVLFVPTIKPRKYSLKPEIKQLESQVAEFSQIISDKCARIRHFEIAFRSMEERNEHLAAENTRMRNELTVIIDFIRYFLQAEKKNPLYRLRREKNNDAVRRSRTKAKQQQKMKDEQIKQLESQVAELSQIISDKCARIRHFEIAFRSMEERNEHLAAENTRMRNELNVMKRRCRCMHRPTTADAATAVAVDLEDVH
ncbi:unnamed protein product [Gongylonema pulchrum]|uniref:BZIP domain-containing protein n=1 Tax=Gongylonema pulchrum TaxID=637853 RepID=A0A183DTY5_9BILA|nr:unnamed protein product [Gongylonema pulchrum]